MLAKAMNNPLKIDRPNYSNDNKFDPTETET